MKSIHDIYIAGRKTLTGNEITIKGNELNLRWIGDSILIWSNNRTPDILLEILETIKREKKR